MNIDNSIKIKTQLLKDKICHLLPKSFMLDTSIEGFSIFRADNTSGDIYCTYKPMIIVVLQGEKQLNLAGDICKYGANQYLLSSVDMPIMSKIIKATKTEPFLSMILNLDDKIISNLLIETSTTNISKKSHSLSIEIGNNTENLLDAFSRLLDIATQDIEQQKILAPMIIREIHYILLKGEFGHLLQEINSIGSIKNKIAQATKWIQINYNQSLNINDLALKLNMSVPTFYRYFKSTTNLSPLQYQKKTKLYEARRLMLEESKTAKEASAIVGYESSTQFNREYKMLFNFPPKTDVVRMKIQ